LVTKSICYWQCCCGAKDGADTDFLKRQLLDTQNRVSLLENEGKIAETVVHKYGRSVCLLHVVVKFLDKHSGRPLQVAVDATGKPKVDEKGMAQVSAGGSGPGLQIHAFSTRFLAGSDGIIFTNHHVVEPWWHGDEPRRRRLRRGVRSLLPRKVRCCSGQAGSNFIQG
jgi:hypothetical protein